MQRNSPRARGPTARTGLRPADAPPAMRPAPAWRRATARPRSGWPHLARAIESDVIPRLVQAHRDTEPLPAPAGTSPRSRRTCRPSWPLIVGDSEAAAACRGGRACAARGLSVETLYLDLLAPAARLLGEMWDDDHCDFATVTVALGRLQRLLRELSPAFGTEVEHPPNGRRVAVCASRPTSSTASACRWWPSSSAATAGTWSAASAARCDDPAARSRQRVGRRGRLLDRQRALGWNGCASASPTCAQRRATATSVVLVGGPIFSLHPGWLADVGADATALDGRDGVRTWPTRLLRARRLPALTRSAAATASAQARQAVVHAD